MQDSTDEDVDIMRKIKSKQMSKEEYNNNNINSNKNKNKNDAMLVRDHDRPTSKTFGKDRPGITKATTMKLFGFLSNDDLFNACLVNKEWSVLALDEQLWSY